jgi:hypothetical protein
LIAEVSDLTPIDKLGTAIYLNIATLTRHPSVLALLLLNFAPPALINGQNSTNVANFGKGKAGNVIEVEVHQIAWKKFTNKEIRRVCTGLPSYRDRSPSNEFVFAETKALEDKSRPWLLVMFSAGDKPYFLALSRNKSKSGCSGNEEGNDLLPGPPFEWLNHKHDGHDCKILDLCGKVNFGLSKKSDSPTYYEFTGRTFESSIYSAVCTQGDLASIARVISSSRLVLRLEAQRLKANPYPFPSAMRPR